MAPPGLLQSLGVRRLRARNAVAALQAMASPSSSWLQVLPAIEYPKYNNKRMSQTPAIHNIGLSARYLIGNLRATLCRALAAAPLIRSSGLRRHALRSQGTN